jgi:signal transduction histidine kinase
MVAHRSGMLSEQGPVDDPARAATTSSRLRNLDPTVVDIAAAAALFALAVLQIAGFRLIPYSGDVARLMPAAAASPWTYVVAAVSLLPIALRRRWPGAVFAVVTAGVVVYSSQPWPPAIVAVGPILAIYMVAVRYGGRRTVPLVILVAGMSVGVSLLTVSVSPAVVQGVGIVALLTASAFFGGAVRTQRALIAEERRAQAEETRRRLDEERLRIAREIHDIMAHSLTLMTVQADAGVAALDAHPDKARDALVIVGETGRATLRDLRSMLDVLTKPEDQSPRAPVPDMTAIVGLAEAVRETGLATTLDMTGDLDAVPAVVAVSAYRIVQESLTNAVRHSGAREVTVRVEATAADLVLEVIDDGSGVASAGVTAGRGIRGMRERVSALGGGFEAGPRPGRGFRVFARIPYSKGA